VNFCSYLSPKIKVQSFSFSLIFQTPKPKERGRLVPQKEPQPNTLIEKKKKKNVTQRTGMYTCILCKSYRHAHTLHTYAFSAGFGEKEASRQVGKRASEPPSKPEIETQRVVLKG
jgi:hypothetical protein